MSDEVKRSAVEVIKEGSHQLRGTLAEELLHDHEFCKDSEHLIKNHGIYQQDNRDVRKAKNDDGTAKGKQYIFMVRTRVPGGKVSAKQFLAHLDLCDQYANETLRVTTRQGFQLHGVLKHDLKTAVQGLNDTLLTTLAACGDVERNVMCCPAPIKNDLVHDQMQAMADAIAAHLKPRTTAYHEIWLTDEAGEKTNVATGFAPVDEPIYGTVYLPRKFKTAIALPEDNCIDIYTQDLGFLAIVEPDAAGTRQIVGYNVLVGGGQGKTPSAEKTFVAIAQKLAFVTPDQVVKVAEAIVKVQRDFGNREDRKVARLKYTIHNHGLDWFKAKVEEYFGQSLPGPRDIDVTDVDDHIGWHEQGDGRYFYGFNVENGRVHDTCDFRLKSALRRILREIRPGARITAHQSLLFTDLAVTDRERIAHLLHEHGVKTSEEISTLRRWSMACVALPTCGLAVAESERVLPGLIDELEPEVARLGLAQDAFTLRMTGCPNACARPYNSDIGIVGRTLGKYTLFLGGRLLGDRLNTQYKDVVPFEDLSREIGAVLACYKAERQGGETLGDFCHRKGVDGVRTWADAWLAGSRGHG